MSHTRKKKNKKMNLYVQCVMNAEITAESKNFGSILGIDKKHEFFLSRWKKRCASWCNNSTSFVCCRWTPLPKGLHEFFAIGFGPNLLIDSRSCTDRERDPRQFLVPCWSNSQCQFFCSFILFLRPMVVLGKISIAVKTGIKPAFGEAR